MSRRRRRNRHGSWTVVLVVAALLLVGIVVDRLTDPGRRAQDWEIPAPQLQGAAPPVVRAIESARELVLAEPASAEAWGGFGRVLAAHGLHAEAGVALAHAEELDPSEPKWPHLLGWSLRQQGGDYSEAFERALESAPSSVGARATYGQALIADGRADEAIRVLTPLVRSGSGGAVALRLLGIAQLQLDEIADAATNLDRALRLAPNDRSTLAALSTARRAQGRSKEADRLGALAQDAPGDAPFPDPVVGDCLALAVDPASASARANSAMAKGRYGDALKDWRLYVEAMPQDPLGHFHEGSCLARLGESAAAREALERSLSLEPDLVPAHRGLADLKSRSGDLAGAIEHLHRALQGAPSLHDLRLDLARRLIEARRFEEIVALTDAAPPSFGSKRFGEVTLDLMQAGRPDVALPVAERAELLYPDDEGVQVAVTYLREQVRGR